MACSATHLGGACILAGVAFAAGYNPYTDETVAWTMFGLFVGSMISDSGNFGYSFRMWLAKKRRRCAHICSHTKWKGRQLRTYAAIDRSSRWSWPYKILHSLPCQVLIGSATLLFFGVKLVVIGLFVGIFKHILLDHPTHQVSWLWWPFRRSYSPDERWNWWTYWPFTLPWWESIQWCVLGAVLLFQGTVLYWHYRLETWHILGYFLP